MTLQAASTLISNTIFLSMVAGIPLYGALCKVKVFDCFVEGARDGFNIAIKIIPYVVGMLVAIGMLRASGAIDSMTHLLAPLLSKIGMPADVLPLALMRPFSGSSANALLAELVNTHGGNSYVSQLAATMLGSTENTFYVLAVYFGAVNIFRTRHAVIAGLLADAAGILASLWICRLVFL